MPFICTFFGFELSLNAPTTSVISCGVIWKAGEVAQTLVPSELKMAALSTWPVPTRLWGLVRGGVSSMGEWEEVPGVDVCWGALACLR